MSRLILLATFFSLLLSAIPKPAAAGALITNIATLFSQNKNLASARNDAFLVTRTLSTIELLRYSPSGSPYNITQSEYSTNATTSGPFTTAPVPAAYFGGPLLNLTQPIPLVPSIQFHSGDTIFIRLTDADQNLYTDQIDSVLVTIDSSTGDKEVLRLYETGNNTGIFVGYLASTSTLTTAATPGDGRLSIKPETTITASYIDIADQENDFIDKSGLFDPVGTVFNSKTGQPVFGVTVTIIDMATGLPAQVFGDDGSIYQPDPNDPSRSTGTVVSGGTATDGNGNIYNFPAGGYRFPLMATGDYKIVLQTPPNWVATLPTTETFPGGPWAITEGSFGEPFELDPIPILRMDIPVDPVSVDLWVEKDAGKDVIAIGDFIPYVIKVTNRSNRGIAYDVTVTDHLPRGFRYRNGSTRIDGLPVGNPLISADGRTLSFTLDQIDPAAIRAISYVVEVAAGAVQGEAINSAVASTPDGFTSNSAKKSVKVTEDLFRSKSLIVGQLLDGCDEDAKGIAGVRIYLEDGTFVITDKDGLYHFKGISPIAHVVQLDTVTLPPGYSSVACEDNTRFAGQNFSQFVELQGGSMWRSDFYASKPIESPRDLSGSDTDTPPPALTGSTELTLTSSIKDRQVRYQIEIGNKLIDIKNLRLTLNLPTALSPAPGSVVIDDLPAGDPEIVGEAYVFTLADQHSGERRLLHFTAGIPENAAGEMLATAVLHFKSETADEQHTPEAVNRFTVTRTTHVDRKDFVMTTHFDSGLADLNPADKQAINDFSQAIKGWQIQQIEVIGHTDNIPLTTRTASLFRDNLGLSVARAATVAAALAEKLNLPKEKIVSHGKGEGEAIGDNRRDAGRASNRRVEIKVWLYKDRIDTTIAPLQMDSGPQQVTTEATALLQVNPPGELHQPAELIVETPAASKPENSLGLLSPLDGSVLTTAISAVRVRIESRLKPLLLLDGVEIPAERIGFTMVDKETKSTLYSYIGVNFGDPGEHKLVLRGLDPFGNPRFEKSATIIRTGDVTAIRWREDGKNIADGKTPVRIRVELRDASGQLIPAGISLTLKGGNLLPPRADAPIDLTIINNDLKVDVDRDGWVEFLPVAQSGAYRTTLYYSEDVSVDVESYVKPELRDWILVGLAEGTVGYNTVSGNKQSLTDAEQIDYYDDGRIAFFAKGKVKGEWLLTAAYDTGKPKVDKLHGTIDPDQYYTLYGDGTDQQYDAASTRKLYVKLERGQFYALFGDYDTGLTVTELARYSRSFNGIKSEMKTRNFSYNAFASETSQAFVRDEIPGDGTSGLYTLSRRDLLINSEKIVIETRDRFHSETIVKSVTLSRHVDYDIDYDSGTLFFKEPIASRDQDFNPIVIVIDFEAMDKRDATINFGGRGAFHAGENVELGVSYIHEGASGAEANLAAIDTKIKFGPNQLRAEVATSQTAAGIGPTIKGDAYLAEVSHQSKDLNGRIYVREQESGFGLGQQSSSESGSRKLGSAARYRLNDNFSISGELSRQSMLDTGAERDLGQVELIYQKSNNYSLRTGLRQSTDRTATGEINRSNQMIIGGTRQLSKRLNLRLNHEQSVLNKDDSADYPTRTLLGADYLLTDKVSIFVEQEFTSSDAQDSNMTRAGLKASPWNGAQMQSTIQQQGSENGPRVFATTGLKQTWQLDTVWSLDAGIDRSQTLRHPGATAINEAAPAASGSPEDFTALSFGANRKAEKWTLSNRIEYRTSESEDKLGLYSGAEGEVRRGLALSGRFQLFNSQGSSGSNTIDGNLRLGAAYRPVQSRWIVLDRLDYLFDSNKTPTSDLSNWRLVNNLNANFRPNRQTQLSFQYGAKYVQENIDGQDYSSFTDLIGLETRHDLNRKWDIGLQGQILHSWSADQFDYRVAPSIGYLVMKNMWLSGGYNLVGFQDADFSAADFTTQGPFVKFRFKFDQNSVREALKQF